MFRYPVLHHSMLRAAVAVLGWLALLATASQAEQRALKLPLRPGVTAPAFLMTDPAAHATVLLLPGGSGGIGKLEASGPTGQNFLVRSRDRFFAAGLNVLVLGRASDFDDLDFHDRLIAKHLEDLELAVDFAARETRKPVWIVGTSRGTTSGAAAAVKFGNAKLAGLVLTSSITDHKGGAVTNLDLAAIQIPVLVVHHAKDGCWACVPGHAQRIVDALKSAPAKELVMIQSGSGATGNPCEAMHFHGYVGAEAETVSKIAAWVLRHNKQ